MLRLEREVEGLGEADVLEGGERSNAVAHEVSRHGDEAEDYGEGVAVFLRSLDVSKALHIIPNLPEAARI